ncbi:MAG: family 16 glycosylhydrolase [Kiritimatiellae bacterium]|nr:family 16 glycosylhydrolase [Kiritimatiellia bacterium]MDD5519916.1 family 16 glycosylhydrolase [Kiritimatiellia bacterium]
MMKNFRNQFIRTIIALVGFSLSLTSALPALEPESLLPPNKKWKLIFNDEFNGNKLDESKWTRSNHGEAFCWNGAKGICCTDHAEVDGHGNFVIKITRDDDGTYRYHHGVQTKGKFQRTYGYFESRVRFSLEPGWWGAVWLYGVEVGPNPFKMGQEIDIFEDFIKPKKKPEFAHNVHFDAQLDYAAEDNKHVGKLDGDMLYRVSRGKHDVAVNDWNAFHVVSVEWTPLEYIFYCDGKETWRMDYHEVPVTTQPMHLLISGCFRDPNRAKGWQGDYAEGKWPDSLTVDYVRVYEEDPDGKPIPKVTLRLDKPKNLVEQKDEVTFHVTADSSVTNLCLFTNGRIRTEKAAASATFTLPAKQLHLGENILIAMGRDNNGLIGISAPLTLEVNWPEVGKSTPYQGNAQAIPGNIVPGYYDEGGHRVAYFTFIKQNTFGKAPWNLKFRTNEGINAPNEKGISASQRGMWVCYTINVEKTGSYKVVPCVARVDNQGFASDKIDKIILELDNKLLTEFTFGTDFTTGKNWWGNYKPLPEKTVQLTEGRHVLRIKFDATPFQFGGLTFKLADN